MVLLISNLNSNLNQFDQAKMIVELLGLNTEYKIFKIIDNKILNRLTLLEISKLPLIVALLVIITRAFRIQEANSK